MSGWDDYVSCVDTRSTQAANILRSGFIQAFNHDVAKAEAAIKAASAWWDRLDPRVRKAINAALLAGGAAAGYLAKKFADLIITESGIFLLAGAGLEFAAGIGAILVGFALGAFLTISADCVGLIDLGFNG